MKVLVACEYSGIVREAFKKRGHDAWSCDLLPTDIQGQHIQGDVLPILNQGWDLMIGHPPCTYISYAGTQVWDKSGRILLRLEALEFFRKLWEAPIPRICLENPKSCASPIIAKYDQVIQPYYFGDKQMKTTWLWLKGLPLLTWSKLMELEKPQPVSICKKNGKKRYFTEGTTTDPHIRSKFWPGIANAMAEQWG
jgi:hypothetical protein